MNGLLKWRRRLYGTSFLWRLVSVDSAFEVPMHNWLVWWLVDKVLKNYTECYGLLLHINFFSGILEWPSHCQPYSCGSSGLLCFNKSCSEKNDKVHKPELQAVFFRSPHQHLRIVYCAPDTAGGMLRTTQNHFVVGPCSWEMGGMASNHLRLRRARKPYLLLLLDILSSLAHSLPSSVRTFSLRSALSKLDPMQIKELQLHRANQTHPCT